MLISFQLDGFLYTLFPNIKIGDQESLINHLKKFYTFNNIKPNITISGNWINIDFDTTQISKQPQDFNRVTSLCEQRKYDLALPILEKLIEQNPSNSDYHRVKGQILSDLGQVDAAIDSLIDALRWNPKNAWALVMMGNLFARSKGDVDTALKYYNQALLVNPNDHITLNNIGANLMQQGDIEGAKKFFWEALKSDNTYPNTHFALGMIASIENDLPSAFYSTIKAIKTNSNKDILYKNSMQQVFEITKKLISENTGKLLFRKYRKELEGKCNLEIEIIADNDIPTAAKIEFAENYQRDKHRLKFKSDYPAVEHLIMHELVHLDFVLEARKHDNNELFISNQENKSYFFSSLEDDIKKLKKQGISESSIANYMNALFDGMNRQIFNAPIDLFIENYLYDTFPELRPYQFISLYQLLNEGIEAVTKKEIVNNAPKAILSKSKIYNIVGALQFKDIFGLDLISSYNATHLELNQAKKFYNEFLEYKDDKGPGEEYELVQHWAEDLKLNKNFELINEKVFREKRNNLDTILEEIEANPVEDFSTDPSKVKEMEIFQKAHSNSELNMAVVMYMVDALQYFSSLPISKIKEIAFEIALLGTQGFNPEKKDYRISHFKDRVFSGYHILSYYYVSWSLAIPEMVNQLGLPFEEEYKTAQNFISK